MQSHPLLAGLAAMLLGAASLTTGCATAAKQEAAEEATRKAASRLDIGADHLQARRNALALREFLAAEQNDPRNPRVHYALGEAYLAQSKRAESERHYRVALEIEPELHDARLSLSVLMILEKRYAEAIVECEKLIDDPTYPSPWAALANLGYSELKQGRSVVARKHLELAREYRKEYWPATLSLSQLELQEGHRMEAIALLREVLELEPSATVEAEANYRIAEIYVSLGRRDQAVGHLSAAVSRTPDGLWGRRSEEYLKLLR